MYSRCGVGWGDCEIVCILGVGWGGCESGKMKRFVMQMICKSTELFIIIL